MKTIYLQQCDNDDRLYIVDRLVNCMDPSAGSVLTMKEVGTLVADAQRRGDKVHITRGNRK